MHVTGNTFKAAHPELVAPKLREDLGAPYISLYWQITSRKEVLKEEITAWFVCLNFTISKVQRVMFHKI